MQPHLNLVILGDRAVGKTSMLLSYAQNKFPDEYIPLLYDKGDKEIIIDSQIKLQL